MHVRCLIRRILTIFCTVFCILFSLAMHSFFLCRPNSIFVMLLYIFVVFNLTHVCLPPMNDHSQWILRNKFYSMHIEAHSSEPLVNLKMKRTITRFFFQDRGKKLLSQFIPWNSKPMIWFYLSIGFETLKNYFMNVNFDRQTKKAMLRDTLS